MICGSIHKNTLSLVIIEWTFCLFYKLNLTLISVGKKIIFQLMAITNTNSSESNILQVNYKFVIIKINILQEKWISDEH